MATRIGIAGVTGRMGQLLVEEVTAAGAELAGGIGRTGSSKPIPAGVAAMAKPRATTPTIDLINTTFSLSAPVAKLLPDHPNSAQGRVQLNLPQLSAPVSVENALPARPRTSRCRGSPFSVTGDATKLR